jgi:hypothetical protein
VKDGRNNGMNQTLVVEIKVKLLKVQGSFTVQVPSTCSNSLAV